MTYVEIAADIENQIKEGVYRPGAKIPSNRHLAEKYRVSISTVQRTAVLLRERGLVFGRQGLGMFVVER